ncbi:hypothetical protein CON17_20190 [Bacillus thuringiensis]|nr:hypothetical protein CON17_20190 [Bacillus thuringiensis]
MKKILLKVSHQLLKLNKTNKKKEHLNVGSFFLFKFNHLLCLYFLFFMKIESIKYFKYKFLIFYTKINLKFQNALDSYNSYDSYDGISKINIG